MGINFKYPYQNLFISKFRGKSEKVAVPVDICVENDIVFIKICQGNKLGWVLKPKKV